LRPSTGQVYVNRYFEKNLTTSEVTTHYYLGGKEIAFKKGSTLEYLHTDHLGSTSVTTNTSGTTVSTVKYFPFGGTRSVTGTLDTDKLFTGQRLDQTGLYYYNARYYDAQIGRFISPDTVGQKWEDPQTLNRYSYCLNDPLGMIDPTGHWGIKNIKKWCKKHVVEPIKETAVDVANTAKSLGTLVADPLAGQRRCVWEEPWERGAGPRGHR